MSSQYKLILKCAKFHCHYACSSEVTGRVFLTLLLQIKYAIQDDPSNIGLTFSSKNRFPQIERKWIFSISLKTHKLTETCKKAFAAVFLSFIYIRTALNRFSYKLCYKSQTHLRLFDQLDTLTILDTFFFLFVTLCPVVAIKPWGSESQL